MSSGWEAATAAPARGPRAGAKRLTAAVSAALVASAFGAELALAQEEETIEEVIAVGSRVVRQELETTAPVTVIGADAVLDSGETDISTLLRETPALNGSLTGTNSVSTGFDSDLGDDTGVGRLNLRNLGTNRTLVLVNGRRHVSAIQGSADVDVNTIPIALIDRVETLTGGSSAIYGADAVTGVINFVLKEDFEGVDYRMQGSLTGEGDGDNIFAAITAGTNFANDRGNVTVSFEFTGAGLVRAEDRDDQVNEGAFALLSNSPALADAFGRDPDASNVYVPNFRINFSSSAGIIALREAGQGGSVFGGLIDGDNDFGIIAGVPALQIFDGSGVREFDRGIESNPFEASGGDGIETVNPFEVLAPRIERFNFNALSRYELTDTWEAYTELKFVRTETEDADGIPFNDDIPIALDNAFIPADLQAQIDEAIAMGIDPAITMSRDILDRDVIPTTLTERNTFRAVGGLRANLANGWVFDASYNYGRTDVNSVERNSRVEDRFFAAVDAVVDPDSGQIVCRSDIDPDTIPPSSPFPSSREGFLTFEAGDGSCVPINLFGTDSITREARGFAFIDALSEATIEQTQVLATLAGDSSQYFSLPGGPIGFALGYEYREERSSFTPPELERAGLLYNTLNEARDIVNGSYDVSEGFVEFSVPLVSDVFLAKQLTVDASYRHTDHSTAGDINTFGTGILWQPFDDIRFRGSFNRAVRAPNIFELFSPAQPSFIGVTADPCNPQNINAGTEFREQNCLQFVDAGFDAADFLSARVAGTTGGNPDLQAEDADTYTVGFVWQPSFLDGALITLDYYNIQIEQAIDSLSGAEIAQLCVDLPTIDNPFCGQVTRNPNNGNAISGFTSGNVNLGAFETDGLDITASYLMDLEQLFDRSWGTLTHSVVANHVLDNTEFPDPLDPSFGLPQVGEFGIPDWILNYSLAWEISKFRMAYQMRWQSSQLNAGISNEDIEGDPNFADPLMTGDSFVHDISFRYTLNDNIMFTGGVNNIADVEPFLAARTRPANPLGRTFFLGVQGGFGR